MRKLFKYSNDNFSEKDDSNKYLSGNEFDIQDDKFSDVGNFFLEQEKKFYRINIKNTLKIVGEKIDENYDIEKTIEGNNLIENEIGNEVNEKNEIEEKNLIEFNRMSVNYSDNFEQILERITNYIKKKFGRYEQGDLIDNNNDKILLKIFIINLVCKDLIYELCEEYHKNKNNYDFFFNLAKKFNDSITGLNNLKKHFEEIN